MTTPICADDPQCRRRVYRASWKFRIGQAVLFGGMAAIILARSRTTMGLELYTLLMCGLCYGRPLRVALGRAIKEKPAGEAG